MGCDNSPHPSRIGTDLLRLMRGWRSVPRTPLDVTVAVARATLSHGVVSVGHMLRRFLYLDAAALSQYIGAVEGGLISESTLRTRSTGTGGAGVDLKVLKGSGERAHEDEESRTLADTDEARFDRLVKAAREAPDELGWVDVVQPDLDFADVGIGAIVSWECDIFVPQIVQTMASSGEVASAVKMMEDLLPNAEAFGLDLEGMPDAAQLKAVSGFVDGLDASLLVVGEDDATEWSIAGHLGQEALLSGELDGRAILVGKVSRVLPAGRWKPFLTFPGMNLMSREQRRKQERQSPEQGKEDQYLHGPALMLDILAIYR